MGFSIGIAEIAILLLVVAGTAFWIWMIVECATKDKDPDRLVWTIIIVFTHIIGAALYFFIRRPVRLKFDRSG
jgi:hypothetical protein